MEQSQFWSKVASQYDEVVDLQIGPGTRAMVRERLARESSLGLVAEFGCGTGFFTRTLDQNAIHLIATDLSPGMVSLAHQRTAVPNIKFQTEDCQRTSFPDASFDTVFMSLVLHFTKPEKALAEMHRILKPGGQLIIANLDPEALTGWARTRCRVRVIFEGLKGYRTKPPKGFGDNVMTEQKVCELLEQSSFKVVTIESFRNASRASYIPIEYIKAVKR